jgi:hypothetical protein
MLGCITVLASPLMQSPCAGASPPLRSRAPARKACVVFADAKTAVRTVKIGTRGSPLALAQAYMTRDLLKVCARWGRLTVGASRQPQQSMLNRDRAPLHPAEELP